MNEIKCPNCGQVFTVDEAGFAAILSQVRTSEFDAELAQRSHELKEHLQKEHEQDTEIRLNQIRNAKDEEINILKMDIEKLKADIEKNTQQHSLEMNQSLTDKEMEISGLKQQIDGIKESQELVIANEIAKAVQPKDEQISSLKMDIEKLKADIEKNTQQHSLEMNQSLTDREMEISGLKQQIDSIRKSQEIVIASEIAKALLPKDETIHKLETDISRLNFELRESVTKQELAVRDAVDEIKSERDIQKVQYEAELKKQRELVEYYKDFKTSLSTKMVGESLEQHCELEFQEIQSYFPPGRVTFYKDNTVADNSKGDFIYREEDEYGNEMLTIMFEMKNEMDTTKTKHKNEHFLKELDKDRNIKKCEYAVLVSMLEADSEYYNKGIVLPPNGQFEKMYIVRPQCFRTIITILRNAALNVTEYKKRAADLEQQNIDIRNFENQLTDFKDKFLKSYNYAKNNFEEAINEIDKTIEKMNNIKELLTRAQKQLGTANGKLDDISIKKLAKDSPSLLAITQNEDQ